MQQVHDSIKRIAISVGEDYLLDKCAVSPHCLYEQQRFHTYVPRLFQDKYKCLAL